MISLFIDKCEDIRLSLTIHKKVEQYWIGVYPNVFYLWRCFAHVRARVFLTRSEFGPQVKWHIGHLWIIWVVSAENDIAHVCYGNARSSSTFLCIIVTWLNWASCRRIIIQVIIKLNIAHFIIWICDEVLGKLLVKAYVIW